MTKVSIIIPSRNEQFLPKTVEDIYAKATGEIEVVVILDGYWPQPVLKSYPNLTVLHWTQSRGMRPAINAGAAIATGKYLMKCDAHCMFAEGFDEVLKADLDSDWVAIPTRKRLDAERWAIQHTRKPDINYLYLSYPDNPDDWGGPGLNGKVWDAKNRDPALKNILIDDAMSAQGSAWFMHRQYFYDLELMDDASYGSFWNEFQEIGLKCWLSGGRVIRNKKTWYAHLFKGKKYGRGYRLSERALIQGRTQTMKWLKFKEAWDKQTLPLAWLIEKFEKVPTWPQDWREQLDRLESAVS